MPILSVLRRWTPQPRHAGGRLGSKHTSYTQRCVCQDSFTPLSDGIIVALLFASFVCVSCFLRPALASPFLLSLSLSLSLCVCVAFADGPMVVFLVNVSSLIEMWPFHHFLFPSEHTHPYSTRSSRSVFCCAKAPPPPPPPRGVWRPTWYVGFGDAAQGWQAGYRIVAAQGPVTQPATEATHTTIHTYIHTSCSGFCRPRWRG